MTTLTFVLPRRSRVVLTVTQVAPVCRAVGHITVTGHQGLNRYRFNGFGFSLSPFLAVGTPSTGGSAPGSLESGAQQPETGGVAPHGPNLHSGVLGSTVEKTARAIRWFLVALLAVAIVLLTAASLPRVAVPDARINDLLARHRVELAGLGAVALAAVAVAFLL